MLEERPAGAGTHIPDAAGLVTQLQVAPQSLGKWRGRRTLSEVAPGAKDFQI